MDIVDNQISQGAILSWLANKIKEIIAITKGIEVWLVLDGFRKASTMTVLNAIVNHYKFLSAVRIYLDKSFCVWILYG